MTNLPINPMIGFTIVRVAFYNKDGECMEVHTVPMGVDPVKYAEAAKMIQPELKRFVVLTD